MFRSECVDMAREIDIGRISRLRDMDLNCRSLDCWQGVDRREKTRKSGVCVLIDIVVGDLLLYRPVLVELM